MSGKNNKTVAQAADAQAADKPTVPGVATPTSPDAAAGTADAAAGAQAADEADADEDHDADDSDDEEKAELRQLVRQLRADKADLQQQLTDERLRSGDVAGELNESEKLVEDLQARLKRADTRQAQSDTLIVSHGEVDYKVLAPKFQFEGKVYQAADLQDDAALVAKLVDAGVGFLHKIEAGE